MMKKYYVYILRSEKDGNFYVGYTLDLKKRLGERGGGGVRSTSYRRPLFLVYFEGCMNQQDALHREKYLKTAWGKKYIKGRIKNYLSLLDISLAKQIPLDSLRHRTGQGVGK